jgi:FkbM family methyltransferase
MRQSPPTVKITGFLPQNGPMIGKFLGWVLGALAGRLQKFGQRVRNYENDPEMVRLLRRGVGLLRDNTGVYHEAAARLFVAEDVDGVPQCLIDLSDRSTIRWLYQKHLRRNLSAGATRPLVIDLGANDGFIGSMSSNFIQLGWDAIVVEPLPEMMRLARANLERYSRDGQRLLFIEAALGPRDGLTAFETGVAQDLSDMEGHVIAAPTATSRQLPMIAVETFLARTDVSALVEGARPIVLSVDIEGQDLPVTTRMLEGGLKPHFIIFESIRCSAEELEVFGRNGYEHLGKIGWNDIYGLARAG